MKLTRTLMIIPISVTLGVWRSRRVRRDRQEGAGALSFGELRHIVPVFIGWFLLAVAADTLGVVPHSWHGALSNITEVMITVALAAIGLSTNVGEIRKAGLRPLALGAMLWFLVAVTSLGLQHATGSFVGK